MTITSLRSGIRIALGAIGLSAGTPKLAAAQAESNSCAQSGRVLETGRVRKTDLETMARCPATGPKAIVQVWTSQSTIGEAELATLVATSISLPDGRLFASVAATAADPGQSTSARLGALQVLAAYNRPELRPSLDYLKSPKGKKYDFRTSARTVHPNLSPGHSPLPESRFVEIPALLARLAHTDPDSVIRGAALHLRQDLALFDPKNTPVDASKITLEAGCGPRVSLQSTEDIPLELRVRVLGTSFDQTYALNRYWDGRPRLPLGLPPGIVLVTYAGREMARLTQRNIPCPPGLTDQ